ncbi:MAG: hypothetical protein R3218_09115 [Christiangramia sp.]|nr:hypothetical protein [Christiangramia sp.]
MTFYKAFTSLLFIPVFFLTSGTQRTYAQEESGADYILLHDSITTGQLKEIHLASLKGWKFSPKDDPSFSSIQLDDSNWIKTEKELTNPENLLDSLWQGFGWFRLKLKVDSTFHPAVTLQSYPGSGAVELYINDSLVLKRGTPALSPENQVLKPANYSVGEWYQFTPGETYQLAVKYSFHDYNILSFFSPMNPKIDFGIHMFPPEKL